MGRTVERMGPGEEDVAKELYEHLVPPYLTAVSSVSLASAIPLLNRYCAMLPHDLFSQPAPLWLMKTGTRKPRVYLQLPINSLLGMECLLVSTVFDYIIPIY